MTSSAKLYLLLGILSLVVGISSFGVVVQSSSESFLDLNEILAEQKDNTHNEWWIFVVLSISESYWDNLNSYSLKIKINEQTQEMIPDLVYQKTTSDKHAFVASFSDLQPGTYQVLIQWNDDVTSKVWIDEKIQLGSSDNQNYNEIFHQIAPAVLLVTILALTVIFPGHKMISNHHSTQIENKKPLEEP